MTSEASEDNFLHQERWQVPSARDVAAFLMTHRNDDVMVNIEGIYVPVSYVRYDNLVDVLVIEVDTDGEQYQVAMSQRRKQ